MSEIVFFQQRRLSLNASLLDCFCLTILQRKLETYCDENDIAVIVLDTDTKLMGSGGIFDSLDLVNFIVEIEEALEEELNIELTLADEKAMSRRTSPFMSIETLASYITERIHE